MIHPTAIIDPEAVIDDDVDIGAYSVIGANVHIARRCVVDHHVSIQGKTVLGFSNRVRPFCSIGHDPMDKKYQGEAESELFIGNENDIRQSVVIHRGTRSGGGKTVIGDRNLIMTNVQIAHDSMLGDDNVITSLSGLSGHVQIGDFAILGGLCAVSQFCRIGNYSFVGAHTLVKKDIPPFLKVLGNRSGRLVVGGVNTIGLSRQGFPSERVHTIKQAYRILYRQRLLLKDALRKLEQTMHGCADVELICDFIRGSKVGIIR